MRGTAAAKAEGDNVVELSNTSNGGEEAINNSLPYTVTVAVEGAADFLFHRWNPEAVEEKAKAAKNSAAKKSDNIESYVYRNEQGLLGIPGEYFRGSIINAARYRQDPRSPRKSAMDMFKAGIVIPTLHCAFSKMTKDWDYLDKRRVMVQRAGINRTRPAMRAGWKAEFQVTVMLPEYIDQNTLREVIEQAGRLVGVGDFRPTYGRYGITSYSLAK